jgi:molybdate/tungstate transport system ATP-binding protein
MQEDILYTPEELAIKLKLSKYTIYEMIKRGDIKAHHIGRSIRVSESQLSVYLMGSGKVDNIFEADITNENGESFADLSGSSGAVRITVPSGYEGHAKIAIRPEDIILSKENIISSARNIHRGRVKEISADENSVKVTMDIGVLLASLITKRSLNDMAIKIGDELYAVFKTMAVKVIK